MNHHVWFEFDDNKDVNTFSKYVYKSCQLKKAAFQFTLIR